MNISVHIRQLLALIVIVLMCACNETDELPTQQMGRVEVRLVAPYRAATRATGDWLDPVDSKEKIHQWWVAFVNSSNIVQELVSGDAEGKEQDVFTFLLPPGTYTVYGFANLDNFNALGITKGAALPDLSKKTLATTNGWTENIPMSSHSGGQTVKVFSADYSEKHTDAAPGTIVSADSSGIGVACRDGKVLLITQLQAPGKKRMSAADYLRGHRLSL